MRHNAGKHSCLKKVMIAQFTPAFLDFQNSWWPQSLQFHSRGCEHAPETSAWCTYSLFSFEYLGLVVMEMMVMHVAYPQIGTQWERILKIQILTATTVVLEVTCQGDTSRIDRRGCKFYMYYFTNVATNSNAFLFLDMWMEKTRKLCVALQFDLFCLGTKRVNFFLTKRNKKCV